MLALANWIKKNSEIVNAIANLGIMAGQIGVLLVSFLIYKYCTFDIERQYASKYWEKQLGVYSSITELSGSMVSNPAFSSEYVKSKNDFEKLYFGSAYMVISPEVNKALAEFKSELDKYERDPTNSNQNKIKVAALKLAKVCRKSCKKDWELPIEEL